MDAPTPQPPPLPDPADEIRLEPEAELRLDALDREARRIDVQRAKLLARIAKSRHHQLRGCASLAEYGAQRGYRTCITRDLAGAGHLMEAHPVFEADLLSGRVAFRAAAALQEVLQLPGIEPDRWIAAARDLPARDFCAHVEEARAALAMGAPPIRLSLLLTPRGHLVFRDAKAAVEQQRQRILSDGEAVQALSEHYLGGREPPRGAGGPPAGPLGPRRPGGPVVVGGGDGHAHPGELVSSECGSMGGRPVPSAPASAAAETPLGAPDPTPALLVPTTGRSVTPRGRPGRRGRYVPAAVRRAVRLRWKGRCAVPHCPNRGILHYAHGWIPHRDGGPADARNLLLLCDVHNQMMERGLLRVGGTPEQPLFFDHEGRPYRLGPGQAEDDARDPPAGAS